MTTDVDLPAVGKVDKRVVIALVVSAGGFVGYRYFMANKSAAATDSVDATTSEFDDSNPDPSSVLGAVSPTNSYGIPDNSSNAPDSSSTDSYGFHGTSNDQWSQYAAAQLAQTDKWDYGDIVESLGLYLTNRPTSKLQQSIVTSAIGVAGYPPVGQHTLINAPIPVTTQPVPTPTPTPAKPKTLATPTGLHVSKTEATSIQVRWTAVPGAKSYEVKCVGTGTKTVNSTDTSETFSQLHRASHYTFTVAAVGPSGLKSGTISCTATTKR